MAGVERGICQFPERERVIRRRVFFRHTAWYAVFKQHFYAAACLWNHMDAAHSSVGFQWFFVVGSTGHFCLHAAEKQLVSGVCRMENRNGFCTAVDFRNRGNTYLFPLFHVFDFPLCSGVVSFSQMLGTLAFYRKKDRDSLEAGKKIKRERRSVSAYGAACGP